MMSNKPRPVDIELVMLRTYSDEATVVGQDGKTHAVAKTRDEQAILLLDGITQCAAHPVLNPGIGRLVNALKLLLDATDEWAAARDTVDAALDAYRGMRDSDATTAYLISCGDLANLLGIIKDRLNNSEGAVAAFREALGYSQAVAPQSEEAIISMGNLADALATDNSLAEAQDVFEEADALAESHDSISPASYAGLQSLRGLFYKNYLGNYSASREAYLKAIRALHDDATEDHTKLSATIFFNLAQLECDDGNESIAQGIFEKALAIALPELGESHPLVIKIRNALSPNDSKEVTPEPPQAQSESIHYPPAAELYEVYKAGAKGYYRSVNLLQSNEYRAFGNYIVADGFETDRQTNFRLKRDDALVLSDAIRRRKVIPRLIPDGARERHDFDGWRKSWWYVPAAMVGCRYVTPLILHQSGIWGFKDLGGDLRLLVDFEDYTSFSTTLRAPASLLAAVRAKGGNPPEPSAQDAEWIEMSFGTAAAGVDAFKVVFNEVLGTEQLGFHLLIVDAMLEVWWPTVAEFRGKEFFVIPEGMFLDFDSYADVIAWAAADDATVADLTVAPDTEESDETVDTAEQESTDTETPVEPVSLLEQPAFKTLILRTKRIARHSKAATLTPLLILCAAVADALEDEAGKPVPFSKATSTKIHAAAAEQGIMFPSARQSRGAPKDDLMPLSDDLKVILKQYRTSTLRDFLKALIAALD